LIVSKNLVSMRKARGSLTLRNPSLTLHFTSNPRKQKAVARLQIHDPRARKGAPPLSLDVWTGFAAITGHVADYFFVTEPGKRFRFDVLENSQARARVRVSGLEAASWSITWDIDMSPYQINIEAVAVVGRRTRTDSEVDLFAFEVPPSDEAETMYLDSGYIFPPKEWFATAPPEITYGGNANILSVLDHRPRFRFAGDGHDQMTLFFRGGQGIRLSCSDGNYFLFVPAVPEAMGAPRSSRRLAGLEYRFRSHERFAVGTPFERERRVFHPGDRLSARISIESVKPHRVETIRLRTRDRRFDAATRAYHRTHAHSCIGHRYGFSGGWHNAGRPGKHSVSFEYFMHGRAHLYSIHPAVDDLYANAIQAVYETDTRPDGFIWAEDMAGRGAFYESNASMLFFLADYVRRTGDTRHLSIGRAWAEYILRNIDAKPRLFKAPDSTGVTRSGGGSRICNWWDVVACGGYDGFINVLTYPALKEFAKVEALAGNVEKAKRYDAVAEELKRDFNRVLWSSRKGRYIGWLDTEGKSHDSFYTFINTMAVWHGIADRNRGRRILTAIEKELSRIGYRGFSLPCNLEPIPPDEYDAGDWWEDEHGYPHFYDPFGIYENGGIWIWTSAYYTAAWGLYDPERAYRHFQAILEQYRRDNLQGAGNGYFWDPATGEMLEGSKQEPYLSNTVMSIWGLYTLFGIDMDVCSGIGLRPRLPKALADSEVTVRYRGDLITFRFRGHGRRIRSVRIDGRRVDPGASLPWALLQDGGRVDVELIPPAEKKGGA
jgi:hypothetical protein